MDLTPAQAHAVLTRLLSEKTINARDITRALRAITDEITSLEERLAALRELQQGGNSDGVPATKPPRQQERRKRAPRKKPAATKATSNSARAKSMQLQGKYLSLLNKQPKKQREKFKRLAQKEGREAAIKSMEG